MKYINDKQRLTVVITNKNSKINATTYNRLLFNNYYNSFPAIELTF